MNCHLSEITELKYTSLIKIIILEKNFKWRLEAFASELFNCTFIFLVVIIPNYFAPKFLSVLQIHYNWYNALVMDCDTDLLEMDNITKYFVILHV